jgi:hypothetical protein
MLKRIQNQRLFLLIVFKRSFWSKLGILIRDNHYGSATQDPSIQIQIFEIKTFRILVECQSNVHIENAVVHTRNLKLLCCGSGLVMSVILIHYFVAVVQPKREKQSVKAMYSIEYSPQYGGDSRSVYSMYPTLCTLSLSHSLTPIPPVVCPHGRRNYKDTNP